MKKRMKNLIEKRPEWTKQKLKQDQNSPENRIILSEPGLFCRNLTWILGLGYGVSVLYASPLYGVKIKNNRNYGLVHTMRRGIWNRHFHSVKVHNTPKKIVTKLFLKIKVSFSNYFRSALRCKASVFKFIRFEVRVSYSSLYATD